jgi:hypothetical protein
MAAIIMSGWDYGHQLENVFKKRRLFKYYELEIKRTNAVG